MSCSAAVVGPAAVARRLSEPSRISWRRMTTVKICIDVADLDEAGAFYCQALQCTEVGRNSRTVKLTAGGNELYLILRPEGSMPFLAATEGRSFARHWTPVHLDFPLRTSGGPHRRSPGSAESSRARSRATGAA